MGFIDADMLRHYRAYAFVVILIVAAIITPPDLFTLILVTIPIYALYEVCILVLLRWAKQPEPDQGDNEESDTASL